MKMQLLGTTALVGASLLFAAPAVAQNVTGGGKGTTVTLTGALDFQAGFVDQDLEGFSDPPGTTAPDRGYGFVTNSELAVKAKGKTDAGMKWSAKIEIEVDTHAATTTDELQLTLSGSWGSLVLGNEDGAEDLMQYGSAQACGSAGSGCTGGDWVDWTNWATVNKRFADEPKLEKDSSDATKISYYTPRINGLQLGVSFAPDTGASGQAPSPDNAGKFETFFGLGANYVKKFDGFNVAFGVVGAIADTESKFTPAKIKVSSTGVVSDTAEKTEELEDLRSWRVGGVVGFGAFKIGGGYQDVGDGGQVEPSDDDMTAWDVGIGWSQGPVKLGLGYLHSEVDVGSDEAEHDLVTLGASYTLGKGLVVYVEGWWFDGENATTSSDDNDAVGLLIGTTVKF